MYAKTAEVPRHIKKLADYLENTPNNKKIPRKQVKQVIINFRFNTKECEEVMKELEGLGMIKLHKQSVEVLGNVPEK